MLPTSGVATRPIEDLDTYRQHLTRFVYQTGMFMRPVFSAAKLASAKRVAYAEGEDDRVLRAAQLAVDEGLAKPILIGRPAVIEARIKKAGLHITVGKDVECVDPEDDPRFRTYWETYHQLGGLPRPWLLLSPECWLPGGSSASLDLAHGRHRSAAAAVYICRPCVKVC